MTRWLENADELTEHGYTQEQFLDYCEKAYKTGAREYTKIEMRTGNPKHHPLDVLVDIISSWSNSLCHTDRDTIFSETMNRMDNSAFSHALNSLAGSFGVIISSSKRQEVSWVGRAALPHSRKPERGGGG